jgi:hypothetical protein
MADERCTSRSRNYRDDRNRDRGYKTSRDSDYKRDKFEQKAPPEFSGKPCHVHGDKAKHTYEECRDNPKILPRPWQQGKAHLRGLPRQPQKSQVEQWQSRRQQQKAQP